MKSRRVFLRQLVAAGGLAALPTHHTLAEIASYSAKRTELTALSPLQAKFLTHLADIIIPATDTPSASETGVVMFIDSMLTDWYTETESKQFLHGLDLCRSESGPLSSSSYLIELDARSFSSDNPTSAQCEFFRTAKKLVLIGYFTSRDGMIQSLHTHGPVGEHSFNPSGPPGDPIKY